MVLLSLSPLQAHSDASRIAHERNVCVACCTCFHRCEFMIGPQVICATVFVAGISKSNYYMVACSIAGSVLHALRMVSSYSRRKFNSLTATSFFSCHRRCPASQPLQDWAEMLCGLSFDEQASVRRSYIFTVFVIGCTFASYRLHVPAPGCVLYLFANVAQLFCFRLLRPWSWLVGLIESLTWFTAIVFLVVLMWQRGR